jgi:hypothetical protein
VAVPFVHYGRFHVRLEKEGHASVAREVRVTGGVDAYPIVDLPMELAVRERRFRWTGRLEPLPDTRSEAEVQALLERAQALREETLAQPGGDVPAR